MTEYEDMAVISKFHLMAEKLKLLNHNSFSINITNNYLTNIFRGRSEYELIYSLRGAKHRADNSVHIR